MGVNIWVTGKDGERIPICWGVGLVPSSHSDGGFVINFMGDDKVLMVRETPAEIMALVAAEERKQQRREIAGNFFRALAEFVACRPTKHPELDMAKLSDIAVEGADALLAALDAREGAE